MNFFLYIALGLSLSALFYAYYLYKQVLKAPVGSDRVAEISGFIKEGANAFLKKVNSAPIPKNSIVDVGKP